MYRVIPEDLFYDDTVSDRAKMIYMELAYMGDGCDIKDCKMGGSSIRRIVEESLKFYVRLDGDTVNFNKGSVVVKEIEAKKSKGKEISDDVKRVVNHWNKTFKPRRNITCSSGIVNNINARLTNFSVEDLELAIDNRYTHVSLNEWYNTKEGRPHKNRVDILFRSDSNIEKYCNMYSSGDNDTKKVYNVEHSSSKGLLD